MIKHISTEKDTRTWMVGIDHQSGFFWTTFWIYFLCWCWEFRIDHSEPSK